MGVPIHVKEEIVCRLLTLDGSSKPISNILEKFCPRWCDVAAWKRNM